MMKTTLAFFISGVVFSTAVSLTGAASADQPLNRSGDESGLARAELNGSHTPLDEPPVSFHPAEVGVPLPEIATGGGGPSMWLKYPHGHLWANYCVEKLHHHSHGVWGGSWRGHGSGDCGRPGCDCQARHPLRRGGATHRHAYLGQPPAAQVCVQPYCLPAGQATPFSAQPEAPAYTPATTPVMDFSPAQLDEARPSSRRELPRNTIPTP